MIILLVYDTFMEIFDIKAYHCVSKKKAKLFLKMTMFPLKSLKPVIG